MTWVPLFFAAIGIAFVCGVLITAFSTREDYWVGVARENADLARKAMKRCEEWQVWHEKAPPPTIHSDLAEKDDA